MQRVYVKRFWSNSSFMCTAYQNFFLFVKKISYFGHWFFIGKLLLIIVPSFLMKMMITIKWNTIPYWEGSVEIYDQLATGCRFIKFVEISLGNNIWRGRGLSKTEQSVVVYDSKLGNTSYWSCNLSYADNGVTFKVFWKEIGINQHGGR